MLKKILLTVLAIFMVLVLAFAWRMVSEGKRSRAMSPPEVSGLPCPDKPNCVSSLAATEEHRIDPLESVDAERIKEVLQGMGIRVVSHTGQHIHGEHESNLFGFIDDIDVVIGDGNGPSQIRSASRVGHSDMGVNRVRVEAIRRALGSP